MPTGCCLGHIMLKMHLHDGNRALHTQASLGCPQGVFDNMISEQKLLCWKANSTFLSWNLFQSHFLALGKILAKHSGCGDSKIQLFCDGFHLENSLQTLTKASGNSWRLLALSTFSSFRPWRQRFGIQLVFMWPGLSGLDLLTHWKVLKVRLSCQLVTS